MKTDDSGEELEGGHTETVKNKSGKVTFSDINFTKVGTYKYKECRSKALMSRW